MVVVGGGVTGLTAAGDGDEANVSSLEVEAAVAGELGFDAEYVTGQESDPDACHRRLEQRLAGLIPDARIEYR